eukprot:COSAG03_NODE_5570_length_1217_cov_1.553667_2_plen_188_part_01
MAGNGLDPGLLKSLRLLRLGKMMRLAKLYRTLKKYERFQMLKPFIGLATLLGIVVLAAHLLACFWFLIGSSDQRTTELDPATGEPVICSAARAAGPDADCEEGQHVYHTVKGWVAVYEEEEWWGAGGLKTELGTRYATSMYGLRTTVVCILRSYCAVLRVSENCSQADSHNSKFRRVTFVSLSLSLSL